MYTVLRFSAGDACTDEMLVGIGARLNGLVPRAFERLDRVGRRFSVSVSSKDDWETNIAETLAFIRAAGPAIDAARKIGIIVAADTAIEPEDFRGRPWLSSAMPPDLMAQFVEADVSLIVTVIAPGLEGRPTR